MKPEQVIHSPAFPCNPRPFARRIEELCTADSGAIRGDACKACLLVLVQMAYGQLATLDTFEEGGRLMAVIPEHHFRQE